MAVSFGKILKEYVELGEKLYGIGVSPELDESQKREARRRLKYARRMIEQQYPDVRKEETDTYRFGAPRSYHYIPTLFVEYDGVLSSSGVLTYPDGSRDSHAEHGFSTAAGLRKIIATLAYYGKIHPEQTVVVKAGSALPVVTFLSEAV